MIDWQGGTRSWTKTGLHLEWIHLSDESVYEIFRYVPLTHGEAVRINSEFPPEFIRRVILRLRISDYGWQKEQPSLYNNNESGILEGRRK